MSQYQQSGSHVVWQPVALKLNSFSHRASLDGEYVAVKSGIDPIEEGSIGRMPGGRQVPTANLYTGYPYQTKFTHARGTHGGWIPRTKLASSYSGGGTMTVRSSVGFEVGHHVVAYSSGVNAYIGKITAISGNTLSITLGTGGGDTTAIDAGSDVAVCNPTLQNWTASDTLSYSAPFDLERGASVQVITSQHGSGAVESRVIESVTYNQVVLTSAITARGGANRTNVIIPTFSVYAQSILWGSIDGSASDDGDVFAYRGGVFYDMLDASAAGLTDNAWTFGFYDRGVLATNGADAPMRFNEHTVDVQTTSLAAMSRGPTEPLGFPDIKYTPGSAQITAGGSGSVTAGVHKVLVRFVDKSVFPFGVSPPFQEVSVTAGSSGAILINWSNLIGNGLLASGSDNWYEYYLKPTHFQIWMTQAGGASYFLAEEKHVGVMKGSTGALSTSYSVSISDTDLAEKPVLPTEDYQKGMPPRGKGIHYANGLTMIWGASEYTIGNGRWNPEVPSGSLVYFSRTDTEEPENFPPDNFKVVGKNGDRVIGAVDAGDSTVLLSPTSFTVLQRAGTFVIFKDGGDASGCVWENGYTSLGSHACWVGEKSIWLYNGLTGDAPEDIGRPIRDWVEGLSDAVRVRVGYDPVNALLWVGKIGSSSDASVAGEAMVYSFAHGCWTKREGITCDGLTRAFGIESSEEQSTLYRMAGGRLFEAIDYENNPVVDGGWDPTTNTTLRGTFGSTGSITSITGLTLASGGGNAFAGVGLLVQHGNGTESYRLLTGSSTTQVSWGTALSVTTGDTWIIGSIPFKLRLAPIRGEDPFAAKKLLGFQAMFDGVNYDGQTEDGLLTVKVFRNFTDSLNTGSSGTISIGTGVALTDKDWASNVSATGKVLEVQVEQVDRHVDFSLIYCGAKVDIPGSLSEDRSSAK